jgi:alkylation response protein AidB-like acyl-CoA dehydrogenase
MGRRDKAILKQYVATACQQMLGGSGNIRENPPARALVDSRLSTIGGGADEVMKEVMATILKI